MFLLLACLTVQVFASWHAAQHGVHDAIHCNICVATAQLDHAVLVTPPAFVKAARVAFLSYDVVVNVIDYSTVYFAYDAQGPPVF